METALKLLLRSFVVPSWAHGSLPDLDADVQVDGVQADIEVRRDAHGVPHIEGESLEDVGFAVGYCHAQDRLWHMETLRRMASGRLSEILGAPALPVDVFCRKVGWGILAEGDLQVLQKDARKTEDARRALAFIESYANGVNAGANSLRSLPAEFRILRISREPWTVLDSLSIARLMCFVMSFGWQGPVIRQWLRQAVGDLACAEWCQPSTGVNDTDVTGHCTVPPSTPKVPLNLFRSSLPQRKGAQQTSEHLVRFIAETFGMGPGGPEKGGNGSNWYSIHGKHNASGSGGALLASDPHLNVDLPHVWYEVHMKQNAATDGEDDPLNCAGVSIPGLPMVMIGHNEHIAWGVTLSYVDMEDVFLEKVSLVNAQRLIYEHHGMRKAASHRCEKIMVKGEAKPRKLNVFTTCHGVIISGITNEHGEVEEMKDLGGIAPMMQSILSATRTEGHALSFCSVTRTPRLNLLQSVLKLNKGSDFEDFKSAVRGIESIGLNVGYADAKGNCGYALAGRIPVRPGRRGDEMYILEGRTGYHDWQGLLDVQLMPAVMNPVNNRNHSYVVSANSAIVDYRDYPHYLGQLFVPGFRKQALDEHIEELLSKNGKVSLKELRLPNLSFRDILAEEFVKFFKEAGPPCLHSLEQNSKILITKVYEVLVQFDGDMNENSAGAAIYTGMKITLRNRLMNAGLKTSDSELPAESRDVLYGGGFFKKLRMCNYLKGNFLNVLRMLKRGDESWWVRQAGGRDQLLLDAYFEVTETLTNACGEDPTKWRYGAVHKACFSHAFNSKLGATRGTFLDAPPMEIGGSSETPNQVGTVFEPYEVGDEPYAAVGAFASARFLFDCGDWDACRSVIPTGQSGNYQSEYYLDQLKLFKNDETKPMHWTRDAVVAATKHLMYLRPAKERSFLATTVRRVFLIAVALLVWIYLEEIMGFIFRPSFFLDDDEDEHDHDSL